MDPSTLLYFGLELHRLQGGETGAAGLGDSLELIEAGGLSLAPFDGPALQPVLGLRRGHLDLSLAPGLAGSVSRARSSDGREAAVSALGWKLQARAAWTGGPALAGLDLGVSGAQAWSQGSTAAEAPLQVELAPAFGLRAPLGEHLELTPRARVPIRLAGSDLEFGLGGALLLAWRS